ncbi:hypothetical protein HF086_007603, partial [Spodoptera exigua]
MVSGDQLTSFLTAFANSQAEANRQLVESLMASHAAGGFTATPSPTPSSTSKAGNMSKCTSRFDGQNRDPEIVESFIDSVEMYKECALVNDDLALRGLPMLLHGEAAVWWRGIRTEVSSWSEAVKRLRSMYGTPCPAHKLYRKIFANEQSEELADSFIVRIRGMIAKFPYLLPEEAKIDIIYGLLHKRIRKRLPRDTVNSIESLIDKARDIEESIMEDSSASTSSQSAHSAPTETTTPTAWSAPAGPRAPRAAATCNNLAGNGVTTPSLSGAGAQQSISPDGPASEPAICPVVVDVPRWNASSTRDAQLADPEVAKIIHDLEGNDELNINRWSERGYLLTQGVLFRNAAKGVTSKFNPKRDGPYVVSKKVSPTTYLLAHDKTGEIFGKYHVSDLRPYHAREGECPEPIIPKRNRGRPRK